jgi:hypothetical protein
VQRSRFVVARFGDRCLEVVVAQDATAKVVQQSDVDALDPKLSISQDPGPS